jgi:hypothetical protein
MLCAVNNDSQYTKKRSFSSESNPKVHNQTVYKTLQLVYLDLSSVREQAWYPECLAAEP